ncbi:MAG: DNA mismatch repair endonuclease MutL [Nitrospirae bacterium]|nr:DNA mismatch repair endonuclease MutL [Nitrospirota bacterium]
MPKIHILPENLSNKIAAGEIVERPASVVKELVENAIDAGATRVFVEAEDAGRRLIRVSDDGEGMGPEDARQAFERHATSKLRTESDLAAIRTMGFRGEALPSIGAVARVRMVTAPTGASIGTEVRVQGGAWVHTHEAATPAGTLVEVEELFYNTPARKKFLKSNPTELAHIVHAVQQQALPHFWIHFRLTHNGQVLLDLPIVRDEMERAMQVMGPEDPRDFLEVSAESDRFKLKGLVSRPGNFRATREQQEFFLNRRAVRNASLSHAVSEAYGTLLAKGRHPVSCLFIEVDPSTVDVNVHPAKREVRFRDNQAVHQFVKTALRDRLRREGLPAGESGMYEIRSGVDAPPQTVAYPAPDAGTPTAARPFSGRPTGEVREAMEVYRPLDSTAEPSGTALLPVRVQPFGQVDQTYIVAVFGGDSAPELHLIDQHAAHERLLYERLLSQQRDARVAVQPLLIPEVVEFPAAEAVRVREILPLFDRIGLEVEEFGERSFRIRAVPALLGMVDGRTLMRDILDDVSAGATPAAEETVQTVIASMACHAAIKAHQPLQPEQMARLLEDLYRQEVPPTCPHGRPIRVRFRLTDLEKLFQRR